jgi:hypothetical protein
VVIADYNINGPVKLNTSHFGTGKELAEMNIMDLISGNHAECAAHATHNPGLLAVGDVVVANNMVPDIFL